MGTAELPSRPCPPRLAEGGRVRCLAGAVATARPHCCPRWHRL